VRLFTPNSQQYLFARGDNIAALALVQQPFVTTLQAYLMMFSGYFTEGFCFMSDSRQGTSDTARPAQVPGSQSPAKPTPQQQQQGQDNKAPADDKPVQPQQK
jgi:hypothetical protein